MGLSLNEPHKRNTMLRVSTNLLRLLTLAVLTVALTTAASAAPAWPLKSTIDLSSGFGDYRDGHFHFGLDLRTDGVIGKPVFAPADGYVWRVRTSYTGYGKALYIHGDDGSIYVMAHLSEFYTPVDQLVKTNQVATERYYVDLSPPADSLRVKKGELVAYSGQTGVGAPHLHFERRDGDTPLNPLTHGFNLPDKTRPTFERLAFQMTDDHSVLANGRREMFYDVVDHGKGRFGIDTVLYFNRPFGLLADCFDRMRPGGMKQAVYRLSLYIDDGLRYRSVFDSVDFKTGDAVGLEYDYVEAVNNHKSVRRLFDQYGNTYVGSGAADPRRGVFGSANETPGVHKARIEAEDAFGNKSSLTFTFVWGPRDRFLFGLDSLVRGIADTNVFYLSSRENLKPYDPDSVEVFLNIAKNWGRTPSCTTTLHDDGTLTVLTVGNLSPLTILRAVLYPKAGGVIEDVIFNGINDSATPKARIVHEVVEDGMLVLLDCAGSAAADSRLELYHGDTLLGIEYPEFLNAKTYICYVPPRPQYRRIDVLKAVFSRDTSDTYGYTDSVNVAGVGFDRDELVPIDKSVALRLSRDDFFAPRFVELEAVPVGNRAVLGLNSNAYRIYPPAFVTRKPFDIIYDIPIKMPETNRKSGLCWLDETNNKWVWLDNTFSNDTLTAGSIGGGYFAAVFDYEAPRISDLTIHDGYTYGNVRPAINFVIEDTLSGIEDDRSIVVKVDNVWLIPEYEPETGLVRTRPLEPLEPGRHHLGIQITDRAGNTTEQYLNFVVKLAGKKR